MTASDPEASVDHERSLAARALDLLVYVPAGVLATALEDMPEMAVKGRARVEQQVRNAHVVGRFAVGYGLRQLKQQVESMTAEQGAGTSPASTRMPPTSPAATAARTRSTTGTRRPRPHTSTVVTGARSSRDPEVDRAIPDYDALSASQVVRRLDGLDARELRAVERHEGATRGRRTILHRAEQLLGTAPPPPPGSPATP